MRKIAVLTIVFAVFSITFAITLWGAVVKGYLAFIQRGAPTCPSGQACVYVDSVTHLLNCLLPGAVSCMPTGGGGSGTYQRGATSSLPSCSSGSNGLIFFATDAPLAYGCNGSTYQAYHGTTNVTPPGPLAGYTAITAAGFSQANVGDAVSAVINESGVATGGFSASTTFTAGSSIVSAEESVASLTGDCTCGPAVYMNASNLAVVGWWDGQLNFFSIISGSANNQAFAGIFTGDLRFRLRSASSTSLVAEVSSDGGGTWNSPTASKNISSFTTPKMAWLCHTGAVGGAFVTVTHFTTQ